MVDDRKALRARIERYRAILARTTDKLSRRLIEEVIDQLEEELAILDRELPKDAQ